jgi:hypothetical protein
MAGMNNFGGKKAAPFGKGGKKSGNTGKKTATELKAQAKKMVKDNMAAGNKKNASDAKKLPPKNKGAQKREDLNFAATIGREIDLSYVGFNKLSSSLKSKGASNPDALAAWIGRRKYGKGKFAKAAAKGAKLGKK